MLSLRTHLTVLTLAILGVFSAQNATSATIGHYTPCMVQPVYVAPAISPAVITRAEVTPPTFVSPQKHTWIVDLADIERPTFVESVFSPAVYDGCEYQNQTRSKYLSITRPGLLSSTAQPKGASIAARVFTDAAACCATPAPAKVSATGGGK